MSATEHAPNDITVAAGAILGRLDGINKLLRDLLLDSEQEPDYDQTYVAGGSGFAADAVVPIMMPRTLRHVELTLNVAQIGNNGLVAVFAGNQNLAQVQQQHGKGALAAVPSNAIATSASGGVTVRDYLDGSGYLTIYFLINAAATIYANVRVRSLDAEQQRPQRT